MPKSIDLSGKRFGKLVAISRDKNRKGTYWVCKCDCGNMSSVQYTNLVSGGTKSCGCGRGKSGSENTFYRHGGRGTKLYGVWKTMRQRCNNSNNYDYRWYGAKGIKVCEEWNDFAKFREWANGSGYKEGLTIDRIDSQGNYEPSNCRWITIQEQQRNKSNTRFYELNGEYHTISEWSKILGIHPSVISEKLRKGKSLYEINEDNEHKKGLPKRNEKIYEMYVNGVPIKEISNKYNIGYGYVLTICKEQRESKKLSNGLIST